MRGRVGGGNGGAPTDLLVCFPSRAHLTLMPKPICSPSRPIDPGKRHPSRPSNRGQASPLFRTKTKHTTNSEIDEPTSPKVTCAGQIKVRPKSNSSSSSSSRPRPSSSSGSSKNWISVVEEIERLHKERKKPTWFEALGIKKDAMQFLNALRSLRFDMRCFGSFHGSPDCTSDEEDDKEYEEEEDEEKEVESGGSNTIFSKWFMVLEDNQGVGFKKETEEEVEEELQEEEEEEDEEERDECLGPPSSVPPPNALLLMRCRSAPAKGWLKGEGEGQGGEGEEMSASMLKEDEKEKERLVLMSYAPDFFKVSMDIAKETWVVGSTDPLVRCRSWKR